MALEYYKWQVVIDNDTGLPEDRVVNTFHFETNDMVGTQAQRLDDMENALLGFYTAIDQYLSANVTTPGRMKVYNHLDPPPRAPLRDDTFIVTPSIDTPFPNEVAICLSYRAALVSGGNRRRRQGRVYLGPLSASTGNAQSGDRGVDSAVRTALTAAADTWLLPVATPLSGADIDWCVFSRSDALGLAVGAPGPSSEPDYTEAQLNAGYHQIVTAWVDNAFDTQRRRGRAPSTRTTVNL